MRCQARDLLSVSKREITPQGYLVAPAVIGRTGVQEYLRGELGLDGDPKAIVRLMRLPEEVFRPETVASFENVPITDDHPPVGVDAANWRDYGRGHVRDVAKKDDTLLSGQLFVMDGGLVAKIVGGKDKLSCGYSFDLDLTPGVAPDGTSFDGYQRNILGDHVADVESPRGGPVCRIGDQGKEPTMKRLVQMDGGKGLVVGEFEEPQATTVDQAIRKVEQDRDKVIGDFDAAVDSHKTVIKAKDALLKDKDTQIAAKDAEIAVLKEENAKLKAIDIDGLVTERATVAVDAAKLAPGIETKGSAHQIRKAAVIAACADSSNKTVADLVFGNAGIEKASEEQVKAVFGALLALPGKAALAAQDAAIGRALGTNGIGAATGPVETIDGVPESRKPRAAA